MLVQSGSLKRKFLREGFSTDQYALTADPGILASRQDYAYGQWSSKLFPLVSTYTSHLAAPPRPFLVLLLVKSVEP
jgi:hypothetical protein